MTEPELQKVEGPPADDDTGEAEQKDVKDVKDVDMDPEDHLNRPDQPDFDPAERKPFDDPGPDVLPTRDEP